MKHATQIAPLQQRREAIQQWLDDTAPYADVDQRHLDQGTPERAYWHLGYQAALADIMEQLFTGSESPYSEDTPSSSPSADPDANGSQAA